MEEIVRVDIVIKGTYSTDIQSAMKAIDKASNEVRIKDCYNEVCGRGDKVKIHISRQGDFIFHLPISCPTSLGMAMNQDLIETLSRYGLQVTHGQDQGSSCYEVPLSISKRWWQFWK